MPATAGSGGFSSRAARGFKEILAEAGISDRRLYDGNPHTTGTILNELGVDLVTIMEIMRCTEVGQTRRHVKGRSPLSKEPNAEPATETRTETTNSRAARARRRRRVR